MSFSPHFLIPLLTLGIGAGVLWANSRRWTNQVFALASFTATLWLFFVAMAVISGSRDQSSSLENAPVPWLRAASAAGAFFPWIIWLLKESMIISEDRIRKSLAQSFPWLGIGGVLAGLSYTEHFVAKVDEAGVRTDRGITYSIYIACSIALYLVLIVQAYRQTRQQTGIKRIEMQFLTMNAGIACLLAIVLMWLGNYLDIRAISRLSSFVILAFFALTVWAVTIHRVFDARQVFLSVAQRVALISVLSLGTFAGWRLLEASTTPVFALVLSIALCSSAAFWLDRKTRDWFTLSVWQNTALKRQAALDIARREPDPNKLILEFEALLRSWSQTSFAGLLFDSGELFVSGDIDFAKDRPGYAALCKQGWTTPESLQRLRPEPGLVDLRNFLTEYNLGVVVAAPRGSPSPSLLLAAGVKTNHRPFTYPEVQQIQEIAEFMDNILARSRLSLQARQSEQLATIGLIGASLAHEIRNPLVSIKTFSSLLTTRFEDPEFRRRFATLIPAEVERIDSLTQQLLDLSNPRRHQMERLSLNTAILETIDLMLTRAHDAGVTLTSHLTALSDQVLADANAIRQVLINLLINAFQALEHTEGERQVQVRTRNSPNGSVILEVSDNGPGIPPEQRARLFHPFVSTKTKGMGLGLAVCADILHEHRATIIVPDVDRPGATFRITFPCPPHSS